MAKYEVKILSPSRIGLFGGTFNPIHSGHIQLAKAAQNECGLDQVLFIPAAEPPHKEVSGILSYEHRSKMVSLACSEYTKFSLCTIESHLPYPSYTIDTFEALYEMWEDQDVLPFFLIGFDAFLEIKTWKDYKKLLTKVEFILSPRVASDHGHKEKLLQDLGYRWQGDSWRHDKYRTIHELSIYPDAVSSTGLRGQFLRKNYAGGGLPSAVDAYIKEHQLYT